MTISRWVAMVLLAVGGVASAPGLIFLGALVILVDLLAFLWSSQGLRRVHYERRLGADRTVWGDDVTLDIEVANNKLLPLAWLRADDFVTADLKVLERPIQRSARPGFGILSNVWTLAPFERVVRHLHVHANRRGVFLWGPVRLRVADVFSREVASEEREARGMFLVRPRTVPVRWVALDRAYLAHHGSRTRLLEDPARYAGVRPYQPGDPLRRIDWRATAKVRRPVSKRFDPAQAAEILLVIDVQTTEDPVWLLAYDEELVETIMVAAASIARSYIEDGAAVGIIAAAWSRTLRRIAHLPARTGPVQLTRIADLLGRLSSTASARFEDLMSVLALQVPRTTTVVIVSGRDPTPRMAAIRSLFRSGLTVQFLAVGPFAEASARRLKTAGMHAWVGRLDPDWRRADALDLVG